MTLRFDGKVAIVTGAGGGLGRAYALLLGSRGAKVVVNDLGGSVSGEGSSSAAADNVVEEIVKAGGEAVANSDSVENGKKIVKTAIDTYGRVDILINNAGILRDATFKKMTDKDWDLVYTVHLRGTYQMTHAAWGYMLDQKYGRIVNVASPAGIYGNFGQANYSAAKLGIVGLTKTLALEGAKNNIKINVVAPLAASRMTELVLPKDLLDKLKPDYVAPVVTYLCHEDCAESGQLLELGSGWIAKLRWQRTKGVLLPQDNFTLEGVRDAWPQISSWEDAETPEDINATMRKIMSMTTKKDSKL